MKMDRRWSVLAFALAFALALTACGREKKPEAAQTPGNYSATENGGVAEDA